MNGYSYETEKRYVFTDEGQRDLLRVRDFCQRMLKQAGAVRAGNAMSEAKASGSWSMMACVDRLVEIGDLREMTRTDLTICWQDRVFVGGNLKAS